MSKKNRAEDRAARAAAALEERRRQEARRRNLMVGGVVIALVVIVLAGFLISRGLDDTTDVNADAASSSSQYGVAIGPDDAPNKVVIYEDFLCPYCGELEKASRDDLAQLAADGKVQVEYRPFDLLGQGDPSSYSVRSAGAFSIVLDKSGSEIAKKFHDLLYENQPSESSSSFPTSSDLADLAVQAGAKESDVRDAIEGDEGTDWVTKATKAAGSAGVQSTPTILLNGKVFQDGTTVDDLAKNLIAELQ
ncbi:DsbA family protein [Nocardioides mangrovi]|uniref:DsbA family protein n=1 Tax=Nocardioides mangrovi TaxID=2874580 RepID=A0ABS7U9Q9_9ACTN|nr:thioredoxin domain-containing protein [Nocardioides mangrovi]MBZ5737397.1 DsbA family protein [Nocardioides mangrovi]